MEEAANQDDDEESNDLDNESVQRVQGLLRMAASQDRVVQGTLQPILSRTITGNQSTRSGLPLQPLSSQPTVTSSHAHILSNQTVSQNVGMSGPGQENSGLHVQPNQQQQPQQQPQQQAAASQSEEHMSTPNYGTPLSHFGSGQKYSMTHSMEDRELQRKMDEVKRKQAEYEENQKKQEEQQLQSQQQPYQPSQHPRSQLHPGMLRLDNLIINGPSVSMR